MRGLRIRRLLQIGESDDRITQLPDFWIHNSPPDSAVSQFRNAYSV